MDPRVADAVWKAIEGHLPPRPPDMHPLGCHRLRISDRDCFQGILVRLVTGCSWDVAARLCTASETTLRARRTEWLAAGVFDKLVEEAIAGYDKIIGPGPVRGRRRRPACTKPHVVVKGPAPTPPTGPRSGGSGRSRPTCSGSLSAGSSTERTEATPSCSNPPCRPSPTAACSPTSR